MEIRFCGGCNPLYHREKLYEMLKLLPENKDVINVQEYLVHTGNFDEKEILKWIMGKIK